MLLKYKKDDPSQFKFQLATLEKVEKFKGREYLRKAL